VSRSGYTDDCEDTWASIRWRGAVASALRGRRGQEMLRELADALDAMPVKELAAESLVTTDGMCCTLGALGQARGTDMAAIDPEDRETVSKTFGIAEAMAAEIMWLNDEAVNEWDYSAYPARKADEPIAARRWRYMRNWVDKQLKSVAGAKGGA